jgi:hypothetical protein
MLKPRIKRAQPPFTGGCAHEESKAIPVDADLCYVRSATPYKAPLCSTCDSPYRAKIRYSGLKRDVPDESAESGADLERKMAEHFRSESRILLSDQLAADDDEEDDVALEPEPKMPSETAHEEEMAIRLNPEIIASIAISEATRESAERPARTVPLKKKKSAQPKAKILRGEELLRMSARAALMRAQNHSVANIRRQFNDMTELRYQQLRLITNASLKFKDLVKQYDLSLSTACILAGCPEALQEKICRRFAAGVLAVEDVRQVLWRQKKYRMSFESASADLHLNLD